MSEVEALASLLADLYRQLIAAQQRIAELEQAQNG